MSDLEGCRFGEPPELNHHITPRIRQGARICLPTQVGRVLWLLLAHTADGPEISEGRCNLRTQKLTVRYNV